MYTFDEQIVSDLYKDVYGTRSMGRGWSALTDDQKQAEWDFLIRRLEEVLDEEAQAQAAAVEYFEGRILETMALVANADRAAAIRIIGEAEGYDPRYGWENLEWRLNIPYGYIKEPAPEVDWASYEDDFA